MIFANGKLYTFTAYALGRMELRDIQTEWVEAVMNAPERYELSNSSGNYIYIGSIKGFELPLFVVVDEDVKLIITVYFWEP